MTGRYRFISEHHAIYGVARLCRVLAFKRRQGYYEWLAAQPARQERAQAEEQLVAEIRAIHGENRGSYGSPGCTTSCAGAAGRSTASASSGSCASGTSSASPAGGAGH